MLRKCKNRYAQGSLKWRRFQGKGNTDLPPFTIADTDFLMPKCLSDNLSKYMKETVLGYACVTDQYYEAVINWFSRRHHYEIDQSWITLSAGVVTAISNAIYAFTKEKDSIIIMSPVYHKFKEVIENLDRTLVIHKLVNENNEYSIDFENFESQIVSNKVKMFLLCSPHNPVGRVWREDELNQIAQICNKHNVLVVSDEIHADIIMPNHKHIMYPKIDSDNCILCTSTSKSFNLAGLKTSNIIIPNEKIRNQYIQITDKRMVGNTSVNTVGLKATEFAYNHCEKWLDCLIELIDRNYQYMKSYINTNLPIIKLAPLEATYLVWMDFNALNLSQDKLKEVLESTGIYLGDGTGYGRHDVGFMRMNIAYDHETIKQAMETLSKGVKEYL